MYCMLVIGFLIDSNQYHDWSVNSQLFCHVLSHFSGVLESWLKRSWGYVDDKLILEDEMQAYMVEGQCH